MTTCMKNVNDFQMANKVSLSMVFLAGFFCQFQISIAYKNVAYKKGV